MPINKERQPVIVGVGRITQFPSTKPVEECMNPVGMMCESARRAAFDAVSGDSDRADALLRDLVAVATPGLFTESRWRVVFGAKDPMYKNFSSSVATSLNAKVMPEYCWRSWPGGNGPQYLMNSFAELISKGEMPQGPILIGGVEENSTFDRAARAGQKEKLKEAGWGDRGVGSIPTPANDPITVNRHGIVLPELYNVQRQLHFHVGKSTVDMYAHFENAYQHKLGRTREEHLDAIAELFSRFSYVAASQPQHSWYPQVRSKNFLKTVTRDNRVLATPYNKWMIARDEIDQSAAFLVMSWAEAERRDIALDRLVFLWGSGDAYDNNTLPCRKQFDESNSMRAAYKEAFRSAGLGPPDHKKVACMDIYSCYPIAVELACSAVGLSDPLDVDVTKLTITGGLPYHGGPGNNYASHSIVALTEKLRLPHYRDQLGVVGANGGMLTEHGVGIYSTKPPKKNYERRDPHEYEEEGGWSLPLNSYALSPNGKGRILSWTVRHKRDSTPYSGTIMGELISGSDTGKRFCAMTHKDDQAGIQWLLSGDRIGSIVDVECDGILQKYGNSGKIYHNFFLCPVANDPDNNVGGKSKM